MEYLLQKEEVEVKLVLVCYFLPPHPCHGIAFAFLPAYPLPPFVCGPLITF